MWTVLLMVALQAPVPTGAAPASSTTSSPPPASPSPTSKPVDADRIVVTPLAAQRQVDEGLVSVLGDVMLDELQKRGGQVVGYSDIQAMLDNEAAKSMLACDGTNCLAELGDAMGARHLVHSSLGRIGAQYVLNLKLIDVEKATVTSRVTRQVGVEDEAALLEVVRSAVRELMTGEVGVVATPSPGGLPWAPVLAIGGAVMGVGGAAVGVVFGSMAVEALAFAPVDPRYPAAVKTANDHALVSTTGWVAGGVGLAAAVVGGVLLMVEE
jgi:hypothetical protein